MILEIVNAKQKLIDTCKLQASPQNLKKAYKTLCYYESLKPAKCFFNLLVDQGKYTVKYVKIIFFNIRTKKRIEISPAKYWLIFLFHEFTHQVLYNDFGYAEHGKIFNKTYKKMLERYFDVVFKALTELQNES